MTNLENESHSDQQALKFAEKQKYLAEAERARSEKKRIDLDYDEALKEHNKPWYKKKDFLYSIPKLAVWATFVVFFIEYVVVPASDYNHKTDKLAIVYGKQKLWQDSINFVRQVRQRDSLNGIYLQHINNTRKQLKQTRFTLDSISKAYAVLLKTSAKQVSNRSVIKKIEGLDSSLRRVQAGINKTNNLGTLGELILQNAESTAIRVRIVGIDDSKIERELIIRDGSSDNQLLPYGKYLLSGYNADGLKETRVSIGQSITTITFPLKQ